MFHRDASTTVFIPNPHDTTLPPTLPSLPFSHLNKQISRKQFLIEPERPLHQPKRMSTVAPAPEEEPAATTGTTDATTPEAPPSPTKYAIVKEETKEGDGSPTTQTALEAAGLQGEGSPVPTKEPPVEEKPPVPKKTTKTTPKKRVRHRRLSFAGDDGVGGQLCTVTYHTNLHYAQQDNGGSSNGDNSNNSNGGCCTIS